VGHPPPFDPEHVTYVWVDALINYLTASGAIRPDAPPGQQGFDDVVRVLVAGRPPHHRQGHPHHARRLLAHAPHGGRASPARRILAHGWWVVGDHQDVEVAGNVVDPLELASSSERCGPLVPPARDAHGGDASYTPERFLTRYEELANILGNLAIASRFQGFVPIPANGSSTGTGDR
jgi:methionyl-tRNA synthetase